MNSASRMRISDVVKMDPDGMASLVAAKRDRPSKSVLLIALFTFLFSL